MREAQACLMRLRLSRLEAALCGLRPQHSTSAPDLVNSALLSSTSSLFNQGCKHEMFKGALKAGLEKEHADAVACHKRQYDVRRPTLNGWEMFLAYFKSGRNDRMSAKLYYVKSKPWP